MNGLPSFKRVIIWIGDKMTFIHSWSILIEERADYIYPAHGKPFSGNDLKKYKESIGKRRIYKLKKYSL